MAMVASSVPGFAVTAASGLGGVAVPAASVGVPAAPDASCVPDEHAASKASPAPKHTYESCFFIDLLRCRWQLRGPEPVRRRAVTKPPRSELDRCAGPVIAPEQVVRRTIRVVRVEVAVLVDQRWLPVVEVVHANVEAGTDLGYRVAQLDRVVQDRRHGDIDAGNGGVAVVQRQAMDVACLPLRIPVALFPVHGGRAAPTRDIAELLAEGAGVIDGLCARLARCCAVLVGGDITGGEAEAEIARVHVAQVE